MPIGNFGSNFCQLYIQLSAEDTHFHEQRQAAAKRPGVPVEILNFSPIGS
jgi:hypothetical protein